MILQQPLLVRFSSAQLLLRIRLSSLHDAQTKSDASCWYLLCLCLSLLSVAIAAAPCVRTRTRRRRRRRRRPDAISTRIPYFHLFTHTVFSLYVFRLIFLRILVLKLFTYTVCITIFWVLNIKKKWKIKKCFPKKLIFKILIIFFPHPKAKEICDKIFTPFSFYLIKFFFHFIFGKKKDWHKETNKQKHFWGFGVCSRTLVSMMYVLFCAIEYGSFFKLFPIRLNEFLAYGLE
jgi:hypothetical protein